MREVEGLVLPQRKRVERVAAVAGHQLGGADVVLRGVAAAALRGAQERAQEQRGGDQREHHEHVERDRDRLTGAEPPRAAGERRPGCRESGAEATGALRHQKRNGVEHVGGRHRADRRGAGDQPGTRRSPAAECASVGLEEHGERQRHRALLVVQPLDRVNDRERDQHDGRDLPGPAPAADDAPAEIDQAHAARGGQHVSQAAGRARLDLEQELRSPRDVGGDRRPHGEPARENRGHAGG